MCPDYSHWPTSPALVWPWILGPVASLASINTPCWQEEFFNHCGKQSGYLSSLPCCPSKWQYCLPCHSNQEPGSTSAHMLIFLQFHPLAPLMWFAYFKPLLFFSSRVKPQPFSAFLRYEIRCPVLHSIHVFEFQEQC